MQSRSFAGTQRRVLVRGWGGPWTSREEEVQGKQSKDWQREEMKKNKNKKKDAW